MEVEARSARITVGQTGSLPSGSQSATLRHPRAAARLSTASLLVIGAFGLALPIMRLVDFAGSRVNASAADLLVLPVLFLVRGRLLNTGVLGYWLFALWMVNLISWTLSASVLTLTVLQRECVKLAFCYLYALTGFALGRELRSHNALVRGMLWMAVPMAAYGIVAFFTRRPDWYFASDRVAGTLGDANAFGIYLGMMLPLVGLAGPAWMIMPLFIGAGVVSFSRTGLAAIGCSLALNWLHLGVKRYLVVAVGCIAVFMIVYTIAVNTTVVGKRLADYQTSLEQRQSLWALASQVTARHPLFGIGKGNWEAVSGSRVIPHNTFLSVMTDGGLAAFAVFVVPVALWVGRGLRRPAARGWAIAVFAGLVGGLAVSLDNFRPFWLAVGVLAAVLSATGSHQGVVAAGRAGVRSPRNRHFDHTGVTLRPRSGQAKPAPRR